MCQISQVEQLRKILENNGINPMTFSLDGYADDRICLEDTVDGWEVYHAHMGERVLVSCNELFIAAALDLAGRVCNDKSTYEEIVARIFEIRE